MKKLMLNEVYNEQFKSLRTAILASILRELPMCFSTFELKKPLILLPLDDNNNLTVDSIQTNGSHDINNLSLTTIDSFGNEGETLNATSIPTEHLIYILKEIEEQNYKGI